MAKCLPIFTLKYLFFLTELIGKITTSGDFFSLQHIKIWLLPSTFYLDLLPVSSHLIDQAFLITSSSCGFSSSFDIAYYPLISKVIILSHLKDEDVKVPNVGPTEPWLQHTANEWIGMGLKNRESRILYPTECRLQPCTSSAHSASRILVSSLPELAIFNAVVCGVEVFRVCKWNSDLPIVT